MDIQEVAAIVELMTGPITRELETLKIQATKTFETATRMDAALAEMRKQIDKDIQELKGKDLSHEDRILIIEKYLSTLEGYKEAIKDHAAAGGKVELNVSQGIESAGDMKVDNVNTKISTDEK